MMKKKINRKTILICCFLISCISLSGCPGYGYSMEDSYSYNVYNINGGDPDVCEYYCYYIVYSYDDNIKKYVNVIKRFSIADQDNKECVRSDEPIKAYAVSDKYIFFSTRKTIKDPYKLWKYDKIAGSCEMILETESQRIEMIATYGDWIIYGGLWGTDLNVCPMEKNPETDSISLKSLLDEESMQKQQQVGRECYVQEFRYQGWRVLFYRNDRYICCVLGIVEEDSGEVIWRNDFLYGNEDFVFWGEGKWILFSIYPGSNFYYQREGETERHRIECLWNSKYEDTGIMPSCLTMEGNRVYGLMSVHRTPRGLFAYDQAEIENDILFELNLETNASKIIYETESAQTRILGYKYGVIYLLEDDVIYKGWIDRPEREKIYDLQEEGWKLYYADGEHISINFEWQGDNLIIRSGDQARSIYISN